MLPYGCCLHRNVHFHERMPISPPEHKMKEASAHSNDLSFDTCQVIQPDKRYLTDYTKMIIHIPSKASRQSKPSSPPRRQSWRKPTLTSSGFSFDLRMTYTHMHMLCLIRAFGDPQRHSFILFLINSHTSTGGACVHFTRRSTVRLRSYFIAVLNAPRDAAIYTTHKNKIRKQNIIFYLISVHWRTVNDTTWALSLLKSLVRIQGGSKQWLPITLSVLAATRDMTYINQLL